MNACTSIYYTTCHISSRDTAIQSRSLRHKRPALRPVIHTQAHPCLHILYHPCAHSLTIAHCSVMSIPKRPFIPINPLCFHPPQSLSPFTCCSARMQGIHGDRDIADCAVILVWYLVYVCMYATITVTPHASTVCIYSHSKYSHINFTCMIGCASLQCTFCASCIYCSHNLNFSRSSMGAQSPGWRVHNIAWQALCCCSQKTGFHQMFLPLWLGSSSCGRVSSLCLSKRGKCLVCVCFASFLSHLFFALETRTLWQNHTDCMPDPGSGEQAIDTHCSVCSLISFGIVYFMQFNNMHRMYCAPCWAEVCFAAHS